MFMCRQLFARKSSILVCYSTNSAVKKWLETFPGGSVTLTKLNDDVTHLSLNNVSAHNSLTGSMMSQLEDCIQILERDSPRAVIFASKIGSFCSGANLNFVTEIANSGDGNRMSKFMQFVTNRLGNLPSITFAILEGAAFGGGAELALSCDFRFIAPSGKVSFKQRELGVTTGWGGGPKLIQLVGRQEAFMLLLKANVLESKEALSKGLVDRILSSATLEERFKEALSIIDSLVSEVPKDVLFAIKKEVTELSGFNTERGLEIERSIFSSVWGKANHINILKKFGFNKS